MSVASWVADRVPTDVVHLDVAGAGRLSQAVLAAQQEHLAREAAVGGYVAEAALDLAPGRAALAALVGLTGDDVFLADSAAGAFDRLLDVWPLPRGSRVGLLPGEFGGHARSLALRAEHRGWGLKTLPVDAHGRVTEVPADLDLVVIAPVASQSGVLQPVPDVLAAGLPVLLDVAQAAGQIAVPPGAAAYVGTSRKWLCGPRGAGWGAVDPGWRERLAEAPTLKHYEATGMAAYDSPESHVAGRAGLAVAARSWSPALVPVVAAAGAAARVLLQGAGGWQVREPVEEPTGITTLRHPTADPVAIRAALLERGLVTSVVPRHRAAELEGPLLRVSTHAWVTPGDLEELAAALEQVSA